MGGPGKSNESAFWSLVGSWSQDAPETSPRAPQDAPRAPKSPILEDFWWILGRSLKDSWLILGRFLIHLSIDVCCHAKGHGRLSRRDVAPATPLQGLAWLCQDSNQHAKHASRSQLSDLRIRKLVRIISSKGPRPCRQPRRLLRHRALKINQNR